MAGAGKRTPRRRSVRAPVIRICFWAACRHPAAGAGPGPRGARGGGVKPKLALCIA